MSNIKDQKLEGHRAVLADKTKPFAERKNAHNALMHKMLNPRETFDPATFDPMDIVENYDIKKRPRTEPPARLQTNGMMPKEMFQGQMIGMYESKQDLYLIMAHYINDLLERIEKLEGGQREP